MARVRNTFDGRRARASAARASLGARSVSHGVGRMTAAHVAFFADHPDLVRILHPVRGILKYNRLELTEATSGGVSGAVSVRAVSSPGRRLPRRWPRLAHGYAALARSCAARRST
jgi:hypothetical protein